MSFSKDVAFCMYESGYASSESLRAQKTLDFIFFAQVDREFHIRHYGIKIGIGSRRTCRPTPEGSRRSKVMTE